MTRSGIFRMTFAALLFFLSYAVAGAFGDAPSGIIADDSSSCRITRSEKSIDAIKAGGLESIKDYEKLTTAASAGKMTEVRVMAAKQYQQDNGEDKIRKIISGYGLKSAYFVFYVAYTGEIEAMSIGFPSEEESDSVKFPDGMIEAIFSSIVTAVRFAPWDGKPAYTSFATGIPASDSAQHLSAEAYQSGDGDRYGDDVRLIRSDERVKIVRHDGHDNETWYMLELGKSVPDPLSIDEENRKLLKHATQNYVLDNSASLDAVREIFSDKVSLAYIHFIISQSCRFEYVSVFLMGDGQNVTSEYADENYLDLFSWLVENIKPVSWDGPLPYCRGALLTKAYGQDSVVRRDTIENMVISYYDEYVSVTRLNGGLEQSDFKETFQYDVDRNKNAMVELVDYRLDLEPSKKAIMSVVRGVIDEAKLLGVKCLTCPLVLSRSLNLEYFEIRGELPMWTSEDYFKVYNILNDVRITGFKLWREPVPYVFFTLPIVLVTPDDL